MLTEEQKAIINSKEDEILVNACAGSGKTTTLYNFAESRLNQNILYLAFNRAMREEAEERFKHLDNTEVRTIHSLAYGRVGYKYSDKLTFKYKSYQLAEDLGYSFYREEDIILISKVRELLNDFLRSKAETIDEFISNRRIEDGFSKKKLTKLLKEIFELKKDTSNDIKVTHNFYLKLFHLQNPNLERKYDLILLDEAQDVNNVIIDIFKSQPVTKVAVGDSNQQIYAWNGAVDALDKLDGKEYFLSNSFRIGPDLARICNLILHEFDKAEMKIKGKNEEQSLGEVDKKSSYTKLCRTRSMVFDNAVESIESGENIYFEGGVDGYNFDTFTEAYKFSQGKNTNAPLLKPFDDYDQLKRYVEHTEDLELEFLLRIVKKYGDKIPGYVKKIKKLAVRNKNQADIILSTLHRAKGLEYNQLVLENDFIDLNLAKNIFKTDRPRFKMELEEEINIVYVALTRAKGVLELNEKIKNYLSGEQKSNLNSASLNELREINGIGRRTAKKIINYRESQGKIRKIEELKEINGVGNSTMNKIERFFIAS